MSCGSFEDLERHHVPPRGVWIRAGRPQPSPEIVRLCRGCHVIVHGIWGEGHNGGKRGWAGPKTAAGMLAVLREPDFQEVIGEAARRVRVMGKSQFPKALHAKLLAIAVEADLRGLT